MLILKSAAFMLVLSEFEEKLAKILDIIEVAALQEYIKGLVTAGIRVHRYGTPNN